MPHASSPLHRLMTTHARAGRIEWIGLRTERRGPMLAVDRVRIEKDGLVGDHRARPGKRAVTLMQWEHLPVVAALAGVGDELNPARLRRNILVSGINLLALRDATFRCGSAMLRGQGLCAPCSRMTEELGPGGYNAVRGHGGIIAEVVEAGGIRVGNTIEPLHDRHGATAFGS